jgi:hypothetical protein
MTFAVEAWTIEGMDDEEPARTECADSKEFRDESAARTWAWDKMGEGFLVRLWRR